ncbi:hypothetical protein [Pyrococcus yayanosii]|uniref:Regulator of amino acid metabolism, contains ACT domain protein n=1 Tax=Pyrococcus yayanosii (strain CH1 / JCM 16557) TaxID=529709 RepID=F8AFZ7_PYRYC|nr:hypothetical protein [Pyrococcus yayanosii]AEH25051.1 hypothetical protein PYCH_13810 [Pyrococcus yayanosii CH1]
MIHILEAYFKNFPARRKVVEFLWEAGLSVKNGKVYVRDVEVPISGIAKATGVNRKIVYHTIEYIESKPALKILFENISPTSTLISVAPLMGWEVLELTIQKGSYERAIAKLFSLLAEHGIRVVEISGRNPYESDSKVYVVIDGILPFDIFTALRAETTLEKIVIHTPEKNREKMICPKCEVKYCPRKLPLAVTQQP